MGMGWWNEITLTEQILYIVAAASTILLLIQTVLSMIGVDSNFEQNAATVAFRPFTVRGVLSFFSIGAWVTIVAYKAVCNFPLSFGIGAAAGFLTVFLTARAFQKAMQLRHSKKGNSENLTGTCGEVYVTIPPRGEGKGKVSIMAERDRLCVFNAIAYEDNKIPTGTRVRVAEVLEADFLLVERFEKDRPEN